MGELTCDLTLSIHQIEHPCLPALNPVHLTILPITLQTGIRDQELTILNRDMSHGSAASPPKLLLLNFSPKKRKT